MLRQLIMETEKTIATQHYTEAEFESFGLYSLCLLYRLVSLVQYRIPASPAPDQNLELVRLLGFAGLAHLFVFTVKLPRMGTRMRTFLSKQLQAGLEITNIGSCQMAYPEVRSRFSPSSISPPKVVRTLFSLEMPKTPHVSVLLLTSSTLRVLLIIRKFR